MERHPRGWQSPGGWGECQLFDTLSLQVAKPLVEEPDCLHKESVLIQNSDTQTWLLHCLLQSAMLVTYRPSPGCPGTAKAWPVSQESKDFLFKPSLRKGNHFSISSSQGDPNSYFALRVRSWGLLLIQFYFSLL